MTRSTAEEVAALTAKLEAFMTNQERVQETSLEGQRTTNSRLLELEISNRDLVRRANEMEPVVNAVKKGKIQVTGALVVLGVIGSVIWAILQFAKDWFLERMGM